MSDTPRTDAAWRNEVHTASGAVDLSAAINMSRQLERENADLRRQIDLDTVTIKRLQEFAYRDEATIADLHKQLAEWQGVARRNDPVMYEKWEESERQLAAERAAREAAEKEGSDARVRNQFLLGRIKYVEQQRDAAADLAREECAKICEKRAAERFAEFGVVEDDTNAAYYDGNAADWRQAQDEEDENCAAAIRSTITDPAAVKRTLEDAALFRQAVTAYKDGLVQSSNHDGYIDILCASARKGEEGKS